MSQSQEATAGFTPFCRHDFYDKTYLQKLRNDVIRLDNADLTNQSVHHLLFKNPSAATKYQVLQPSIPLGSFYSVNDLLTADSAFRHPSQYVGRNTNSHSRSRGNSPRLEIQESVNSHRSLSSHHRPRPPTRERKSSRKHVIGSKSLSKYEYRSKSPRLNGTCSPYSGRLSAYSDRCPSSRSAAAEISYQPNRSLAPQNNGSLSVLNTAHSPHHAGRRSAHRVGSRSPIGKVDKSPNRAGNQPTTAVKTNHLSKGSSAQSPTDENNELSHGKIVKSSSSHKNGSESTHLQVDSNLSNRQSGIRSPQPPKKVSLTVNRSKSPLISRTKSPNINRSKSPLISRTKSPNVDRSKSPLISRAKSPNIKGNKSPSITRTKSPSINHSKSPLTNRTKSPNVNRGKSPFIDRGKSPRNSRRSSLQVPGNRASILSGSRSPSLRGSLSPNLARGKSPNMSGSKSLSTSGNKSPFEGVSAARRYSTNSMGR